MAVSTRPGLCRGFLAASAAVLLVCTAGAAHGDADPNLLERLNNPLCLKPFEKTPEIYGPTDIGGTVGNGRLSVAVNPHGTLSVLKWPSPSYYDQLKYKTISRDLPRLGLAPNEGAFSGLVLRLVDGTSALIWLRDLDVAQSYASDDSDTITTRFRADRYGLTVWIDDVVPPDADVLMRRHTLHLDNSSPIASAELIAFANLDPKASKLPYLPVEDWCWSSGTDVAHYYGAADAIVYGIKGFDVSAGKSSATAVAIGANRLSSGHQVGADRYSGLTLWGPQSAYDDASDGALSGNDKYGPAEVDAALSIPFDSESITVSFAAAATREQALALLEQYRGRDPVQLARDKREQYLRWLANAPLPRFAPPSVVRLAKRSLISLHQAIDTSAPPNGNGAAIVAAIATQSPYGADWVRDGVFLNEALDLIGQHELVGRHNTFYAEVQQKQGWFTPPGSPLTGCLQSPPSGNWPMNNYADGGPAGPIPWEIDETGFGLWGLWRHYEHGSATAGYLERIYPAIRRTAEFLMAFRDPHTKLPPGAACEDDELPKPKNPTMHSAGPVLLGMRSAAQAAEQLGQTEDAARYRRRVAELEQAIDQRYRTDTGAYTPDFGDGGWALWPVQVQHYQNPRMHAQAEAAWQSVEPSFLAPNGPRARGQYEAKALLGLAHYYHAVNEAGLHRVKRGLEWIADVQAGYQNTGILGESWYVRDGRVISVVSQPHVWEQILFYLAAIEAYGHSPYLPGEAHPSAPEVASAGRL